jgi:hypothetical protein
MALVRCRECGSDVSSEATVCPKCGAKNPAIATDVASAAATPIAGRERVIHERVVREPVSDAEIARNEARTGGAGRVIGALIILALIALAAAWYFGYLHINGLPQPGR